MRHAPLGVNRVPMKSTPHVIPHAAERHRPQRFRRDAQEGVGALTGGRATRVLAQEKQQLGRTRKLRRVAEPAVSRVECFLVLVDRDVQRVGGGQRRFGTFRPVDAGRRLQPIEQLRRRLLDARSLVLPDSRQFCEQVGETRPAPSRGWREIRAAEERFQIGR